MFKTPSFLQTDIKFDVSLATQLLTSPYVKDMARISAICKHGR